MTDFYASSGILHSTMILGQRTTKYNILSKFGMAGPTFLSYFVGQNSRYGVDFVIGALGCVAWHLRYF